MDKISRAWDDAWVTFWDQILLYSLITIPSGFLVALWQSGWTIVLRTLLVSSGAGLGAFLLSFLVVFVWHLGRVILVPKYHPRWKASRRDNFAPDHIDLIFELTDKKGVVGFVPPLACEVMFPTGERCRAVEMPSGKPTYGVFLRYLYAQGHDGLNFSPAPRATSGVYKIKWFEQQKNGKWRELLRYSEEICIKA